MEKKYESDLTAKEKRQLEIEKLKKMNWGQRLDYIWTYYKLAIAAIILLIFLIYLGIRIYQGVMTENLLSIAVVDADYQSAEGTERLEEDLLEHLGTGSKYEEITVDNGVRSDDGYTSTVKRVVSIESGTLDLIICDKETYEEFQDADVFQSWLTLLGDRYEEYEQYMEDGKFRLSDSEKWQEYGITGYEPVYVGICSGTEKDENIIGFVEYFFG